VHLHIYTTPAVRSIDVVEPEGVYLPADGWDWDGATRDETVSKCGYLGARLFAVLGAWVVEVDGCIYRIGADGANKKV